MDTNADPERAKRAQVVIFTEAGWPLPKREVPPGNRAQQMARFAEAEMQAQAQAQAHDGWTNRATWSVALAIDNDSVWLDRAIELAAESESNADLAECLREWIGDHVDKDDEREGDLATDLVRAALLIVNWRELAQHYDRKAGEISR